MPKNKAPARKKPAAAPEDKDDALIQKLSDLALDLVEQDEDALIDDVRKQKESELNKLIKRSIFQKKDELLYEALERTRDADLAAFQLLRERIEEYSEVIVTARGDGKNVEINAFVIPVFARTVGGLDPEHCFQDQDAFDLLTRSLQEAGLESKDAKVVLVNHAYHPDEIDGIIYSHINDMVRDAHAAMVDMRGAAMPAIVRSFTGWPATQFGPDDEAVELRFLMGFALKTTDDAFYRVPEDEEGIDAYFTARAERFERWTEQVLPLVKRCLAAPGAEIDINFQYQDLFHGGKERGIAEYMMLQMMSELNFVLDQANIEPAKVKAVVGPVDANGGMLLRVNLHAAADNALLGFAEKPWSLVRDLEEEIADVGDALATIGIESIAVAEGFDGNGNALGV